MKKDFSDSPFGKYEKLKHNLRSYGKVGVAFSGGIDSSLLLLAAGEVLGRDRVTALHGKSELNIYETELEDLFTKCFSRYATLQIVELSPLDWPDFVKNDQKRCYYCKGKAYRTFLERLSSLGIGTLLDGTNKDDLAEPRAGLAVLEELGVKTPLAEVQLGKREIRLLAKYFGLPNYDQPSNSCLATRIHPASEISQTVLEIVGGIEKKLHTLGFSGCRARPQKNSLVIELQQQDYLQIVRKHNRIEVERLCRSHGFSRVYLDLKGRN